MNPDPRAVSALSVMAAPWLFVQPQPASTVTPERENE